MRDGRDSHVGLILAAYLVVACALLFAAYAIAPPASDVEWKEFGVRAGIALAAAGALAAALVSVYVVHRQAAEARRLEEFRQKALADLEAIKADTARELEDIRGAIARQNAFLSEALDAKRLAHDKLFVASNNCYRELQTLAKGEFDRGRVAECERALREAEGLAANLDDEDREIVRDIVQIVFNVVDLAEDVKSVGAKRTADLTAIWNAHAAKFGRAVERLRERSLFRNREVGPDA